VKTQDEVAWDKLKFVSQEMSAYGDFNTYAILAENMPTGGSPFVMHRKNYISQPEMIKRQADGSGLVTVFDSRGD
jgi:hypothetical protein